MYQASLLCFNCSIAIETWDHLIICSDFSNDLALDFKSVLLDALLVLLSKLAHKCVTTPHSTVIFNQALLMLKNLPDIDFAFSSSLLLFFLRVYDLHVGLYFYPFACHGFHDWVTLLRLCAYFMKRFLIFQWSLMVDIWMMHNEQKTL